MKIEWFKNYPLDKVNQSNKNTLVDHLGITITEINEDNIVGVMPVTDQVKQPFGVVHGGANCVLAETIGSIASNLVLNPETHHAVGLSINTNHVKAVRNGEVKGVARAIHLGRKTHIWVIDTFNTSNELTSSTTLTMAVISHLGTKS